jgi:hypothetical protein
MCYHRSLDLATTPVLIHYHKPRHELLLISCSNLIRSNPSLDLTFSTLSNLTAQSDILSMTGNSLEILLSGQ